MATNPVPDAPVEQASVFQSELLIHEKLDSACAERLDLGARNRLLNMLRSAKGARAIEVVDGKASKIFHLLVRDNRFFTDAVDPVDGTRGATLFCQSASFYQSARDRWPAVGTWPDVMDPRVALGDVGRRPAAQGLPGRQTHDVAQTEGSWSAPTQLYPTARA